MKNTNLRYVSQAYHFELVVVDLGDQIFQFINDSFVAEHVLLLKLKQLHNMINQNETRMKFRMSDHKKTGMKI